MANQVALIAAISLLAAAAKDTAAAMQPGETALQKLEAFQNLIPEALALASEISDIPAEIASLQPSDYVSLAGVLVADLGFSNPHAQLIIQTALKVLQDGVSVSLPDISAFIHAVQNSPAAASGA